MSVSKNSEICPPAVGVGINISSGIDYYSNARDEVANAGCRQQLLRSAIPNSCTCAIVIKDGNARISKSLFENNLASWSESFLGGKVKKITVAPTISVEKVDVLAGVSTSTQFRDGLNSNIKSVTPAATLLPASPPSVTGANGESPHAKTVQVPSPTIDLIFEEEVPADLLTAAGLKLNGWDITVDQAKSSRRELIVLGAPSIIKSGVAIIESAKEKYLYWREDQRLKTFSQPYKSSAAILVAIDDYDRTKDKLNRGKTGFIQLKRMRQRSGELRTALIELGFSPANISELYDQDATSEAIEAELKKFWKGGASSGVERLFFYFGGHGITSEGLGVLVTYDFDKNRPTQTGFLMRDLSTRQTDAVTAKHMLVAIDACASGLVLQGHLGAQAAPSLSFETLSTIRNDTTGRARNFLVAGTEDQPAIYNDGGIFTSALIKGLSGDADYNHDGVIKFSELAQFVRDSVAIEASRQGAIQQVGEYTLNATGNGKILFIRGAK
ncbi:hypothetical protein HNP55_001606 [Paucibacter oligotrophus]|uniref:Peptidase C14 caspase domain-containing protein n=1 Tax=Roseateles oligotrophus TaxID=1769250 RepID=A0A840LCP0_9BURK|nr:caspase family protein [Roseateles oligotrophus]MBB4843087.1 hypothetical protein [Roseateles oligotrophus]